MDDAHRDRWRALMHRWFVEYNPLALLSATLVLGGTTALSHAIATRHLALGGLAVGAIAEVYAWALIAGVAFLGRLGLKRPAAMLALLAVLFQCDPTLSNETWAWCGGAGVAASALWVALFGAKLAALLRALGLRYDRAVLLVPMSGAIGVAVFPHVLRSVDGRAGTFVVVAWVFAVLAGGLWTARRVAHPDGLDVRALRALRGTWTLFAAALVAHVLFWTTEDDLAIDPAALVPALALLVARVLSREAARWALVLAVLAGTAVTMPAQLSVAAFCAAAILGLDMVRRPSPPSVALESPSLPPPYRFAEPPPRRVAATPALRFARAPVASIRRLAVAFLGCLYLSIWTATWSGGELPDHLLALDALLLVASAGLAWRLRARLVWALAAVVETHLAMDVGWVRAPRDALEAGATAIALGFVLLGASLYATWRIRRDPITAPDAAGWPPSPPAPPPPATSR